MSDRHGLSILCLVSLLVPGLEPAPLQAAEPTTAQVDFFEKKIRPILVEQCYRCHSEAAARNKKLKGGLLLDAREGLKAGGDSGPALVPGNPEASLLIKTLRYENDVKMPPKGKLPDAVIADFAAWVKMGAPDPRGGTVVKKQVGLSFAEGRQFWSYRPVSNPTIPAVAARDWPVNDLDRFILAALEAKRLQPSADADRPTLARRLYYDLLGMPPTPAEVDAFVQDRDPAAYEKLVDRLLASPAFGERWGRHWLDIARFAESVTLRGFIFQESWRYRDYVIDCFNRDVPFDRFVKEQLAGDLLPAATPEERQRQIVATAFLVMGNTNLEEQDKKQLRMDVVDEMLDVISKGFLAQTVTCARCHDHKFDPIPTRDYYALAGILRNARAMEHANVSRWIEVPLPLDPVREAEVKKHEAKVAALQAKIKAARSLAGKGKPTQRVLAVKDLPGIVVDDAQAKKVGEWMNSVFSGSYIGTGYAHDKNEGKGQKTITFQPELTATGRYEVRLAYSPGGNRANAVPVTVFSAEGEKTIQVDMTTPPPLDGRFLSLGEFRFERTGQSFVLISNEGTRGHVTADAVVFLPVEREGRPQTPASKPKPSSAAKKQPEGELKALEEELKRLQKAGPHRPVAMSVLEEKTIEDARIHIRGLVGNQGEVVPRGFLQVACYGTIPHVPPNQSGRKELAEWIASRDNPLTARVIVNRTWHWLFGDGLVRTVDNFGTTGERPSNPELLDHLATRFMQDGWSMKKLIRAIVLSRTYRQSSMVASRSPLLRVDPENRLFGRTNRRRLEAECLRDTILCVSGKLNLERGGRSYPATLTADYGYRHTDLRRSVYLPVFRNALPELFEVFDFADPSMVVGRRNSSTVAPQALYLLNNSFPIEQARFAAERLLGEKLLDDQTRLTRAYRLCLGRTPTAGEQAVAERFLKRNRDPKEAWAALFQMLFASADFRHVN